MKPLPALAAIAAASLVLAACGGPAPTSQPAATPAPAKAANAPPASAASADAECDRVSAIVDDLTKRKATGLTESDALAEFSARGDFRLGYVVDGVFKAAADTPAAITKADILASCRQQAKGGDVY